jgi:hypothetical protein
MRVALKPNDKWNLMLGVYNGDPAGGQNRGAGPPFGAGRFATATGLVGDTGPGTGLVGVAVANAGADDATARVRLNGTSVVGAAA